MSEQKPRGKAVSEKSNRHGVGLMSTPSTNDVFEVIIPLVVSRTPHPERGAGYQATRRSVVLNTELRGREMNAARQLLFGVDKKAIRCNGKVIDNYGSLVQYVFGLIADEMKIPDEDAK